MLDGSLQVLSLTNARSRIITNQWHNIWGNQYLRIVIPTPNWDLPIVKIYQPGLSNANQHLHIVIPAPPLENEFPDFPMKDLSSEDGDLSGIYS